MSRRPREPHLYVARYQNIARGIILSLRRAWLFLYAHRIPRSPLSTSLSCPTICCGGLLSQVGRVRGTGHLWRALYVGSWMLTSGTTPPALGWIVPASRPEHRRSGGTVPGERVYPGRHSRTRRGERRRKEERSGEKVDALCEGSGGGDMLRGPVGRLLVVAPFFLAGGRRHTRGHAERNSRGVLRWGHSGTRILGLRRHEPRGLRR